MREFWQHHAAKLVVILVALVVLIPTGLAVNYSRSQGKTADEAKEAASTASRLSRETRILTVENRSLVKRLAQIQHRVTEGLINSCEVNGNPLRTAFQNLLREQIGLSEHLKPSALPNLSPEDFHRLINEGIAAKRRAIRRTNPIDCSAQYLPPRP